MIERQQFVTWYTPEEKMPKEGDIELDEFVVHAWADLTPYGGKS